MITWFKSKCHDCKKRPGIHQYVLGALRCDSCAEIFRLRNMIEKQRIELTMHICECGNKYQGEYECPDCCEHEFDPCEGFHCLQCGTDGSESVMSDTYDRAKDARKYGD